MKRRVTSGFTLIEVIIAVVITTVMIVAVQSATQAMTNTARKQTESSIEASRIQRFAEILRADLHGWYVPKSASAPTSPTSFSSANSDKVLLQFSTTADSLGIAGGSNVASLRSASLLYILRVNGAEFQIVRTEVATNIRPIEIVLWRGSTAPAVDFFSTSSNWVPTWTSPIPPDCLRVNFDGLIILISPR